MADPSTDPMAAATQNLSDAIKLLTTYQNSQTEIVASAESIISKLQNVVASLQRAVGESPVTPQASSNDVSVEVGMGGGYRKGRKSRKSTKRGGAEVNMSNQGSMIYNTSDLFPKNMQMADITKDVGTNALLHGPSPFSADSTNTNNSFLNLLSASAKADVLPAVVAGGGKKKTKKPATSQRSRSKRT